MTGTAGEPRLLSGSAVTCYQWAVDLCRERVLRGAVSAARTRQPDAARKAWQESHATLAELNH
ncbi:MAG TPA: hypothetical protein VN408_32600 [Actinoplanes sp.]|nr:hypothetical protein [Actinoplanes sp.]